MSDIVITGAGVISAIGNDKNAVLQSLLDGKTGIGKMRYHSPLTAYPSLPVGEVKLSNQEMMTMLGIREQPSYINRNTLLGMMAVRQALVDAHIPYPSSDENPSHILLVSGTTVGGMDVTEQYFATFRSSDEHLACVLTHDAGSTTRLIARHFGCFDDTTTLSTACSSAANAIIVGANLIKSGQADIVVAGGQESLTRFHMCGFNALMILDHEVCRPFDATRAGLNLGEGAAYVVLESEASARRRGVTARAWLTGYGNACDAYHQTASSENGEGACLAMQEALAMARLSPADIDYVNAHGTGTPNNDQSETVALQRVFGLHMPPVSSTKGLTGHTTSASGSIETVICLLAMQHGFIPMNYGWKLPMEHGIVPTMGQRDVVLKHVLCNSFGFGGNDSSLILSSHPSSNESRGHGGTGARGHENTLTTDMSRTSAPPHPRTYENPSDITEASRVEITSEDQLSAIRQYVSPMEVRRMGKLMKSALLSSIQALQQAGIETPDAIITATAMGCLEYSEKLLVQMTEEGDEAMKPTLFMQSTHNTLSSAIAIHTHCHGYNVTYAHGERSLEWALRDARMLLASGRCRNVLVGLHDESTPLYSDVTRRLGLHCDALHSVAIVLTVHSS